ncbi:hypothetical protein [Jiangella alba]|uniref:Uncharacterized protein n=1 Tax=Jiangella alba TaxID=561176 RepID=A0A1H5PLG6_9ACTN|nr:hypothetical protein [Jiangella alba]SEF13817.1 hypothetical protein SAMN04488561_4483 [Jiangella alba]
MGYDLRGLWIYEESDPAAPFSDTLNLLAESTSDAFALDRARLDALELLGAGSVWVPTLVNATVGNGTLQGTMASIGKLTFWSFTFTLGSTSTVSGGTFGVQPPVTPRAGTLVAGSGYAGRGTSSTGRTLLVFRQTTGPVWQGLYEGGNLSATSPFSGGTWQASDAISGFGVVLAA